MIRGPVSLRSSVDGERAIMIAWEKFLSGNTMPHDAVRRMVEDSWRRCLDQGVNPIRKSAPLVADDEGLNSLQRRHAELIEAATPVMVQAREFLSESATMMILTDPDGVILSVEGDPNAKYNGQGVQLVPGARWEEAVSGTNAIGTALAAAQPVQICASEHFCEGIKQWTCSATVIRDPYDGRILGALDISGLSGSHNTHCLALAVAGAGRIEARLAALEMEKRARLLDVTLTPSKRWLDGGVVIFDRRGRLVRANENAGLFLNSIGLDLAACSDLALTGLTADKTAQRRTLPEWMKTDWLEPVIDHEERLGTVLAIPLSRHFTAKAASSPLDSDPAVTGHQFDQIIGDSPALNKAKHRALQLAKLHVPVLLLGPTGAGKEVFARLLHNAGADATRPFVPLNCGSMTRDLLASELFGYAEGAFTGARRGGMIGKFEAANGGTLFLDEIGEMPLDLQAHLLRVLEEGEVYRLGENKPRKVCVRVVAATNRNLREEVAVGNFRMDLFYRLAVTVLRLPALAEHIEDIPLLVRHFVEQAARNYGTPARYPSPQVLEALMAYPWPGNVRELRNVVEGMVLLAEADVLTMDDVPPEIFAPTAAPIHRAFASPLAAPLSIGRLADSEREAIIAAIEIEHGNFTRAARRLGIAKSTFYEKMKRYSIERKAGGDLDAHETLCSPARSDGGPPHCMSLIEDCAGLADAEPQTWGTGLMTNIVFVGLDVHKATIAVAVAEGSRGGEVRELGNFLNRPDHIAKLVERLAKGGRCLSFCYEAGPCGYGLHRQLTGLGHECMVAAPSLIPMKAGDRVKTDRRDAVMLAKLHRAGELTAVWVPDDAHEAMRDLIRARSTAVRVLGKARQHLQGFLLRHARVYAGKKGWTLAYRRWLTTVRFDHAAQQLVLQDYIHAVTDAEARVERLTQQIADLAPNWSHAPVVAALQAMRGVAFIVAATLVAEVGDFTRFANPRQLMAYLGLVPSEHSSGRTVHRAGITKAGNALARRALIEGAWTYRMQPRVSRKLHDRIEALPQIVRDIAWKAQVRLCSRYRRLAAAGKPKVVVTTAIAREMLGFVWAIAQTIQAPGAA